MNRFVIAVGSAILFTRAASSSIDPAMAFLPQEASPAKTTASILPLPLHVAKNQVLNSRNERVHLRGVNTPSLEWTSDGQGHILDTVKTAIDDWHANVIRLLFDSRTAGSARAPSKKAIPSLTRRWSSKWSTFAPRRAAISYWICIGPMQENGESKSLNMSCPIKTASFSGRTLLRFIRIIRLSFSICTTNRSE